MRNAAYNAYVNGQSQASEEEKEFYEWLDKTELNAVTRGDIEEAAWRLANKAEKRAFDAGFTAGRATAMRMP